MPLCVFLCGVDREVPQHYLWPKYHTSELNYTCYTLVGWGGGSYCLFNKAIPVYNCVMGWEDFHLGVCEYSGRKTDVAMILPEDTGMCWK